MNELVGTNAARAVHGQDDRATGHAVALAGVSLSLLTAAAPAR